MSGPQGSDISLRIRESPEELAGDAADLFLSLAKQAQEAGQPFRVALSGGSTPRLLYKLLASDEYRDKVPWHNIKFFFGDERWVPHTDPQSNYKLASDELFSKVSVDPRNVFPIPTEGGITPGQAAGQYEATLRKEFGLTDGEDIPSFELLFLGLGEDAHIASCFPGTPTIHERERLVDALWVDKLEMYRITLTPPVLIAAKEVAFLIAGESKAPALKELVEGEYNPDQYPAQLLRGATGNVTGFVDKSAASQLEGVKPKS